MVVTATWSLRASKGITALIAQLNCSCGTTSAQQQQQCINNLRSGRGALHGYGLPSCCQSVRFVALTSGRVLLRVRAMAVVDATSRSQRSVNPNNRQVKKSKACSPSTSQQRQSSKTAALSLLKEEILHATSSLFLLSYSAA